ncbi:MAG: hypothetical protein KKD05_11820 [Candidatus Omnitrophica bacterium]|nr:hypothetical protein [Candidatus Omnitrophota bacterium]
MKKIKYFKILSLEIIGVLLFAAGLGFAQQGAVKTLSINTHRFLYNAAANYVAAAYDVLVAKQFIDRDPEALAGGHSCFGDPSEQSDLHHLTVNDGLEFDYTDSGTMTISAVPLGAFSINFEDGWAGGEAYFSTCTAVKFVMITPFPDSRNDEGKKVWDIAEGINVEFGDACDVVVISKNKDLTVTRSTVKFDSKVAGVISESPKIYMGDMAGNKPLALSGIVKCNVNTQNGPIKKGDILVTSSEPGYAMKANESQVLPGMIIGKALDALDQGKGKIYILIN